MFDPNTFDKVFELNDLDVLAPCLLNSTIHNNFLVLQVVVKKRGLIVK
jgi:hypothetical protein